VTSEDLFELPLYEYQCPKCGRFELIRKFSDPALTTCPTCASEIQKLFSAPAIQFKGTGWYITDYARKSDGKGEKGDSAKGEGGASEASKGEGSKSEASKSEGSKSEGSKSEGSKSEGSKSEGSKSEGAKDSGASSGNKAASSSTTGTKTGGGRKSS
jgi:putative FmdB family regulatory protein